MIVVKYECNNEKSGPTKEIYFLIWNVEEGKCSQTETLHKYGQYWKVISIIRPGSKDTLHSLSFSGDFHGTYNCEFHWEIKG